MLWSQAPADFPGCEAQIMRRWAVGSQGWFKSSFSGGGAGGGCVLVSFVGGGVRVRDSKVADGPVLEFNRGEWEAFLLGAFNGEFEMPL